MEDILFLIFHIQPQTPFLAQTSQPAQAIFWQVG